jgi:ABC-2 type transport system permease protein
MFDRLGAMLMKELIELRRDRWALFRLLVPLFIQVVVFGYAATFTVSHVATTVLDLDHSQASRALVSHFVATGRFDVVDLAANQREVTRDLDTDRAIVAIVIHAGFAQRLNSGQTAPLQVSVDGTNSNSALIALSYVAQIVAQFQAEQVASVWPAAAPSAASAVNPILHERPWFNEGLADRWFFIPGVIGTLTLIQVISLTALAVVREREVGTLEQIMVSPIRPAELILGKAVPFFLIGLIEVFLITLFGVLWFRVPFVGSAWVMLLGASLFLLAAVGLGLLLSTLARTQQQAFALTFFIINPYFILSGFAFPIATMPRVLQWFTLFNPLRYFLIVIRAEFLKGVGVMELWPQLTSLALLAVGMLAISALRFQKSLD